MCSWGDNAAIWAFVPMCLYTGRAQRLGPSWAIWTKLSLCHLAFMSPWWKENANSRRSGNSFHHSQHPDGSWGLWLYSHCSSGKPKQVGPPWALLGALSWETLPLLQLGGRALLPGKVFTSGGTHDWCRCNAHHSLNILGERGMLIPVVSVTGLGRQATKCVS